MAHMRELAERSVETVPGLVELRLGRFAEGDRVVAVGMSLWRDYEALEAFYGDDVDRPLLVDPYGEWVDVATVEHYEHVFTLAKGDVALPGSGS